MVLVSNHPSLLEPWVLPLMGFPWMNFPWVFSPLWSQMRFSFRGLRELQKELSLPRKMIPANVPDKDNFYDPVYVRLFRGASIPVDRNGGAQGRISTVLALKKRLESGGRVLIFPEGTRTFKAVRKPGAETTNGRQLGELKDGAGWLALKTGAMILPIWVEGTDNVLPNNKLPIPRLWRRMVIKIGNPFMIQGRTRREATSEIRLALLGLADEAE